MQRYSMFMWERLHYKDNMWVNLKNPVNLKLNASTNKTQSNFLGSWHSSYALCWRTIVPVKVWNSLKISKSNK